MLLLPRFSPNSLGNGYGTSWGTWEAVPQSTSRYLKVKANKPVEHAEEEEGHWENNSRVVMDVDEEVALLPHTALTTVDHAQVWTAATVLGETHME